MCKLLQIIVLLLSVTRNAHSIPIEEFYPFGESNGDSDFPKNDDGSSPAVTISTLFPFFNNQHGSLYVNTNGVISFLGVVSQYTPDPFPLDNSRRLIAPFWADVDIRNGGTVWYRETTNTSILRRATEEVRLFYPSQSRFVAAWVFIATWDDVAFYGATTAAAAMKRNSFQAVLITNGRHSFTIFNYYNITWTTGTASGGNPDGLGGTPAQVGFNAGDGINFYAVNESRTDAIINLPQLSNVQVDGKFVFRIDTETIEQGGCNTGGTLTISPRYSNMFGGEEKVLAGPCIKSEDRVRATFGIEGSSVSCTMNSMYSVACITPTFYTTGDVGVTLEVTSPNQQSDVYGGIITVLNPLNTKPLLQRLNPTNWKRGEDVVLKWSTVDIPFDSEGSTVEIYSVEPDLDHIPRIQYNSSVVQYIESFQTEVTFTLETEVDVIILCLTQASQANDQNSKQRIWSDAIVVTPRNIDESKTSCNQWKAMDDQLPSLSDIETQVCPCRLDQAEIDILRFHSDPMCQFPDNSLRPESNCLFYQQAKKCFRLNTPGPQGTGQICCYGNNGNLMNALTSSGGGSLQRFHYFGDTDAAVPYLSNVVFDMAPYYHCCVHPHLAQADVSSECFEFYHRRTPGNCNAYVPNIPAQNFGDPHFVTPDGLSYTFNGAGEYILFRTTTNTFIAQVRMQPLQNNGAQGSVITAFVAKAMNSTGPVEVRLNSIRAFDILVNGLLQDVSGVNFLRYKGITISIRDSPSATDDYKKEVNLVFPDLEIAFQTLVYDSFLTYVVTFGPGVKRGGIEGLLGNFNQNPNDDLVSKEGNVLQANSSTEDIHSNMGETWRITEEESLFTYPVGASYSAIQDKNFLPVFDVPVSAVDENLRDFCGNDTFCYYDYYVTNDTKLARSTRTSTKILTRIQELSRQTISCGFPPAVENGQWSITGTDVGDSGRLLCNSDAQLGGSGNIICDKEGNWTASQSTCTQSVVTIDPNTGLNLSDTWKMVVIIGVVSVFVIATITIISIVLIRRFCYKKEDGMECQNRVYRHNRN
ncbi:sushi domain-containing protein 2-like [Ylistrum balloti]|uniref:sushi domain-containing protein 2-like n=1 Tax=Ylistrum balloti TaxID=509963 RepID=UPI0029058352|nr:sushi domain-containing protein 2-like [Ylistrum balloti]